MFCVLYRCSDFNDFVYHTKCHWLFFCEVFFITLQFRHSLLTSLKHYSIIIAGKSRRGVQIKGGVDHTSAHDWPAFMAKNCRPYSTNNLGSFNSIRSVLLLVHCFSKSNPLKIDWWFLCSKPIFSYQLSSYNIHIAYLLSKPQEVLLSQQRL